MWLLLVEWSKEMITIRRAVYEDIPKIMQFIDEHWKKDHILARDRAFFEWMYLDEGEVNFYLGIDEKNTIYGLEGFILYNHSDTPDASGTVWKTIKSENPVLGLEIERYMVKELHIRYGCSAGISKKACKIHELNGCKVEKMLHYYRLNDLSSYKIAKITRKDIPQVSHTGYRLKAITDFDEIKTILPEKFLEKQRFYKDYQYIYRRYFLHPIYHYDKWKIIRNDGDVKSVLITRNENYCNAGICKIVDFYGDLDDLSKITEELDALLLLNNFEYIDVYSFGVPKEIYEKAGFVECKDDTNIIPNYFNPFEQRNVDLNLVDPFVEGFRTFRGDGDQDRPC